MAISTAFENLRFIDLPAIVWQGAVALGILVALYTFMRLFYNVFLHPLRDIPGPLHGRATVLPWNIYSLQGNLHLWLRELHLKYGPVVRFAPNHISSIDTETWKSVYGHRASAWRKDPAFYGKDPFETGIIRADNVGHARQRKLISHAFSEKALRDQEGLIKSYVVILIDKFQELVTKSNDPIDVVAWFNFITFDIMADLTFGESLNQLVGSEYSPWVSNMLSYLEITIFSSVLKQWPLLINLLPRKIKQQGREVVMYATHKVEERLKRENVQRPDIWSYILRYSGKDESEGKGLTHGEMLTNGNTMMIAGTETTATALSGLSYFLAHDQDRCRRLTKEIREAFPTYEDMTLQKLGELKYLHACIEEGFRMYPPVAMGLPRIAPKGGSRIGQWYIPEGAVVQLPQYSAYMSELHFKDATKFIPERWMPQEQGEFGTDNKDILQPFSFGPRNCVGKNLAYNELRLIFASILWHFDLKPVPGYEDWTNQKILFIWQKPSLKVQLEPVRR